MMWMLHQQQSQRQPMFCGVEQKRDDATDTLKSGIFFCHDKVVNQET